MTASTLPIADANLSGLSVTSATTYHRDYCDSSAQVAQSPINNRIYIASNTSAARRRDLTSSILLFVGKTSFAFETSRTPARTLKPLLSNSLTTRFPVLPAAPATKTDSICAPVVVLEALVSSASTLSKPPPACKRQCRTRKMSRSCLLNFSCNACQVSCPPHRTSASTTIRPSPWRVLGAHRRRALGGETSCRAQRRHLGCGRRGWYEMIGRQESPAERQ